MAVTRESMGLTEGAKAEQQETEDILADPRTMAAIREGEAELFRPGEYVRVRSLLLDNESTVRENARPLDYGQVRAHRDDQPDKVQVHWSQASCGCASATEDPADLVKVTEAEYLAFVAGYSTGYVAGYQD